MSAAADNDLVYRIDAAGIIVEVNDRWREFARESQPPGAPPLAVVGKPFWNHLGNRTVVHLLLAMVAKVRRTGAEITVPFRYEGPGKRHHLQLRLQRMPAGAVEFRGVIVREQNVAEPGKKPWRELKPAYSGEFIRMCSWCKQVAAPDWVEVEEAVRRLKLFESDHVPKVTHTICESCADTVHREIRRSPP